MSDKPTIGLLLCQHQNKLVVEYTLRRQGKSEQSRLVLTEGK
jgi:hypothetical protein